MQKGLTLIESMIVLAVIGLLATVAFTKAQQHMLGTKYADVMAAAAAAKAPLEACLKAQNGVYASCAGGQATPKNAAVNTGSRYVASVTTSAEPDGITITARAPGSMDKPAEGLRGESYVLQGSYANGQVTWTVNSKLSTCMTRSGGPICQ